MSPGNVSGRETGGATASGPSTPCEAVSAVGFEMGSPVVITHPYQPMYAVTARAAMTMRNLTTQSRKLSNRPIGLLI